jgi:hypothetical protein
MRFIGAGDCATALASRNENRQSKTLIRVIRTLLMELEVATAISDGLLLGNREFAFLLLT